MISYLSNIINIYTIYYWLLDRGVNWLLCLVGNNLSKLGVLD